MIIYTEKNTYGVSLRLWRGGWNAGYEPDCFNDLSNDMHDYIHTGTANRLNDGDVAMSEKDFLDMCDWWEDECDRANKNPDYSGDALNGLSQSEIDNGDEFCFIVNATYLDNTSEEAFLSALDDWMTDSAEYGYDDLVIDRSTVRWDNNNTGLWMCDAEDSEHRCYDICLECGEIRVR